MNPLFRIDFSISDSLKIVRKSVLIYETIIEGADVAAALHALGDVLLGAEDPVDGDVLVRHLGGEFLLEAVDVDEDAVELLLVGLKLLEAGFALRLPGGEFVRDKYSQSSHLIFIQEFLLTLQSKKLYRRKMRVLLRSKHHIIV